MEFFFCKVVVLQHPNLIKWSGFFAITGIMFWWIFHNSYYMESLQLIDKFCSSPLVTFLNIAYIFMQVIRNGKTFIVFPFFVTMIYTAQKMKFSIKKFLSKCD